ncbi:hypothetical protein J6590_043881 [Homalodisca vitripennis]|nr:hypothetical protein J6590_043881 [Homalodisca vitripennis]
MTRLKFLVTLVDSLSAEWFDFKEQRHPIPDTDVSDDENQGGGNAGILPRFFEKFPNKKERNCCVFSAASTRLGGKRKKSSYICKKCKKGLHTKCFPLHKYPSARRRDVGRRPCENSRDQKGGVAGICSVDGRHLALMPHPERSTLLWQQPYSPPQFAQLQAAPWLRLFQNMLQWCVDNPSN